MVAVMLILAAQMASHSAPAPPRGRGAAQAQMLNLSEVFDDANYPFLAQGRSDEGRVQFRVSVDAQGVATGCVITEAAAANTLNQPTCDLILAKARFAPARDRRGRAVASTFTRRVVWTLQNGAPLAVADGHERVVLTFDGAGKVDCRIEATADVEVDPRACPTYLAMPAVRNSAGSQSEIVRSQMARYAVVSEQSSFAGPNAAERAAVVGKRRGEDLNDRTIIRLTIDPAGKIIGCAVVEEGTAVVDIANGEPQVLLSCARMTPHTFEPSGTGEDRTVWMVSAAYYRER